MVGPVSFRSTPVLATRQPGGEGRTLQMDASRGCTATCDVARDAARTGRQRAFPWGTRHTRRVRQPASTFEEGRPMTSQPIPSAAATMVDFARAALTAAWPRSAVRHEVARL